MTTKNVRVLLVEDRSGDALLIEQTFGEITGVHFYIETVRRIATAIDRLDQATFHVVLLDLNLPDSQGVEGVSRIRDVHPEVPIIALTGADVLASQVIDAGAQDYLPKESLSAQLLVRSIRYALERHGRTESASVSTVEIQRCARELREHLDAVMETIQALTNDKQDDRQLSNLEQMRRECEAMVGLTEKLKTGGFHENPSAN